jgi:hypothetical protein
MRQIDLLQVDTYRISPGSEAKSVHVNSKWRSALEIIVAHEVQSFAEDDMFQRLIHDKWQKFGRRMYVWRTVAPYILLLANFTVAVMLRGADPGPGCSDFASWIRGEDGAGNDTKDSTGARAVILALEVLLPLFWAPWLVWKGWRQRRLRYCDLDVDEDGSISVRELQYFLQKNMHFVLDVVAAVSLMTAGVALLACWQKVHHDAKAVASIFLFCNLLNVMLPFKSIGVLLITIYKMLVGDIARFCLVFFVLMFAFSIAMHLLLQRPPEEDSASSGLYFSDLIKKLLWIALGDNLGENGDILTGHVESFALMLTLYVAWVVLSSVMMLNLIIAMMGKTFSDDAVATHRIWIFPFAALVLKYEKMLTIGQQQEFRTGNSSVTRYWLLLSNSTHHSQISCI